MSVQLLRVMIANAISCDDFSFTEALRALEAMNYFENWTDEELYRRPVDLDQISEVVGDYLGLY